MPGLRHRSVWRTYKRLCLCSMFTGAPDSEVALDFAYAPLIVSAAPAAFLLQANVCDGDVSAHRLRTQKALVRVSNAKDKAGHASSSAHACLHRV